MKIKLIAVFYYAIEEDPDYKEIEGQWLNDAPYGVVHRVVSAHIVKGLQVYLELGL